MLNFKRIVSLARKRSKNPEREQRVVEELLPKGGGVILPEDGGALEKVSDLFFGDKNISKYKNYALEIGFGSGENILAMAKKNPNTAWVGCEVFRGGVVKLLEDMEENDQRNIRIWFDDALELIQRLPNACLDLIYILHPDPWPKRKHNKRRLINEEFLKLLASKMKNNSRLLMITDHADYAQHVEEAVGSVTDLFERKFSDYPEIVKTKYRLKAEAQGFESKYFYLLKR